MKVGIIGSGGREHALCHSLKNSNKISKIYCIPGNAGTNLIAENVLIELKDFEKIKKFVQKEMIDIIIVGPEQPLVDGIVDYLEKYNIKVFGPNKLASQLEGSKIFTKNLCKKYNIPTANFGIFKNSDNAEQFLKNCNLPIVIKADGLAAGKGVYICKDKSEASIAIQEVFNGKFGVAKNILIEEFLDGEEMSFFIISDGKTYSTFGTAQDHKRVSEGDKGKNTGGMGAYSPSRLENETLNKNSYLFLLVSEDITKENLIKEIINYNEDPNRVKFLTFVNNDEHLARHQLIDLYLDTFNYNGHTSAVDALYTGVPVVTKKGKTFTSRVCASILNAHNMEELITKNEEEYFNLILEIATKKEKFNKLKLDLKSNLKITALFNTKKYVQNLELGYQIALENKIKQKKIQDIEI